MLLASVYPVTMHWMLVIVVAGSAVRENLHFPTLGECLQAQESLHSESVERHNATMEWARATLPADQWSYVERKSMLGMSSGTCIPRAS